jgi:transcriptional regulator with XRE-family HTH domain
VATYEPRGRRPLDGHWDAELVRRLRDHLELTQREFAAELNARQQTVSEWETGRYRPRGPSARLLTLIAENADFGYAQLHDNEAHDDGEDENASASLAIGSDVSDDATILDDAARRAIARGPISLSADGEPGSA